MRTKHYACCAGPSRRHVGCNCWEREQQLLQCCCKIPSARQDRKAKRFWGKIPRGENLMYHIMSRIDCDGYITSFSARVRIRKWSRPKVERTMGWRIANSLKRRHRARSGETSDGCIDFDWQTGNLQQSTFYMCSSIGCPLNLNLLFCKSAVTCPAIAAADLSSQNSGSFAAVTDLLHSEPNNAPSLDASS